MKKKQTPAQKHSPPVGAQANAPTTVRRRKSKRSQTAARRSKAQTASSRPRPLPALREQIDRLDERIVALLNQRAGVALEIGRWKDAQAVEAYVPAREQMVLKHIQQVNRGPLQNAVLKTIYREIMSSALALERPVRVAFLGPPATFTHQAARARFGGSINLVACETIGDIFEEVQKGQAEYGVVPIENSTEGTVIHTLDLLMSTPLKICAEIYLRVAHHQMAPRALAKRRAAIRRILSKPEVFGQCRNWLRAEMPGVELVPVSSTARAAEMVARAKDAAAIASALAAEMYGLQIMAADIQDMCANVTRFLVLGRADSQATGDDKTSLMFSVKHRAGSLYHALGAFKKYAINLTKIESRPSRLKAWEYIFFVDIEGHADDLKVRRALQDLEKDCALLTILGAYPRSPETELE
ncbi:MAG: prephenate dehydratase [Lentisphaerae bacterium]|nr:prephenate dehydratase [Lentisphaerota bacterium]